MSSLIPRISFFILLLICSIAIEAQVPERKSVELTGTVNDPYGAVVAGASIRFNSKSSPNLVTKTDIEGKYRLVLAPGEYLITIQAPGFKKLEYRGLRIVDSTFGKMSFDFVLEVGSPTDHEPCGYGAHQCFDDLSPEPIKSNPPIIDTKVQLRPAPRTPKDEEIKLPDHVMEQVVKRVVSSQFKPATRPRTVYIADRNIKKEWLPQITNINFIVLDRNEAYGRNGVYFFFQITRDTGNHQIWFGRSGECNSLSGSVWNVSYSPGRIRLWYGDKWMSTCDYGAIH